jgi:hypothetical protein
MTESMHKTEAIHGSETNKSVDERLDSDYHSALPYSFSPNGVRIAA